MVGVEFDVRFHSCLPCRAGRDGRDATCILFYSYQDAQRMRHMLKESSKEHGTSKEQLDCNMDSLNTMVMYAVRHSRLRTAHSSRGLCLLLFMTRVHRCP